MNGHYAVGETVFGKWKLVREIGEGSYGKVYEAHREDYGEIYKAAVKIITVPKSQSEITSARAEGMDEVSVTAYFHGFVERLAQEFALMSRLKGTANIVGYMDHDTIPHTSGVGWDIIIRMELLKPLPAYMLEHTLQRADIIRLGIDMCRALELCASQSITHRDIKPDNIFVSELGDFKLGDFGIARTMDVTTGATKAGTYKYMAPEIYNGKPYNASVDMYSLGIVLYQLLNDGRTPFLPPYPEPIRYPAPDTAIVLRMSGKPLDPPRNAGPALSAIVLRACAFEPAQRFASPAEMRQALEDLARAERDSAPAPVTPPAPARTPSVPVTPPPAPVRTPSAPVMTPPAVRPEDSSAASLRDAYVDETISAVLERNRMPRTPAPAANDAAADAFGAAEKDGTTSLWPEFSHGPAAPAPDTGADRGRSGGRERTPAAPASAERPAPRRKEKPEPAEKDRKPAAAAGRKAWAAGETVPDAPVRTPSAPAEAEQPRKEKSGVPKKAIAISAAAVALAAVGIVAAASLRSRAPAESVPEEETAQLAAEAAPEESAEETAAEPALPEGELITAADLDWSEWADSLPAEVNSSNSLMDCKLQYRSNNIVQVINGGPPGSGYRQYGDYVVISGYGKWQDANGKSVSSNAWTDVRKVTTGGGDSGWSDWSETRTTTNRSSIPANSDTSQVQIIFELTDGGTTTWGYQVKTRQIQSSVTTTQYRTRQVAFYYVSENNWTEYSDTPIPVSADKLIGYRMQYRYAPVPEGSRFAASMDNFPVYTADYAKRFRDVDDSAWYGADKSSILRTVCELGIFYPDSDMNFYPEQNVSLGQIIRAAVIINRVYGGYTGLLGENNGDYQLYADYAVEQGLIRKGEFTDLSREASRQEMAYILYNSLPAEELAPLKKIDSVTDMDMSYRYYDCALAMAEAGIINLNGQNQYRPEDTATRAEAASIIDKLVYPASRTTG